MQIGISPMTGMKTSNRFYYFFFEELSTPFSHIPDSGLVSTTPSKNFQCCGRYGGYFLN
jgi:hypothetical protein